MKVLHIFDCAAVAPLIARAQREHGYEAKVTSYARMDPFGFLDYYGEHRSPKPPSAWFSEVLDMVPLYDILHVHFLWGVIPSLKKRWPKKPIIMHYLGSDLRQHHGDLERQMAHRMADAHMCSIGDIMQYAPDATRFYAPVDTQMFKYIPSQNRKPRNLIFLTQPRGIDKNACMTWMIEHGFKDVEVWDRTRAQMPYEEMPKFLEQYGTYIDIRYQDGKVIDDWSSTAEQCMSMGMNVYDWEGNVHHGLPEQYKSENVWEQIKEIYESLTH